MSADGPKSRRLAQEFFELAKTIFNYDVAFAHVSDGFWVLALERMVLQTDPLECEELGYLCTPLDCSRIYLSSLPANLFVRFGRTGYDEKVEITAFMSCALRVRAENGKSFYLRMRPTPLSKKSLNLSQDEHARAYRA